MMATKRIRRIGIATVTAVALVGGISACSATPSSDNKNGNLTLAIWDPAQKAGVQKAVDGFEKANPNIKVDLQVVPATQYYTKLNASLSTHGGPDVMWQSSHASVYINGGALEPLDSYIKSDHISLSAYPKKLADLYHISGRQFGMPKDQDVWSYVYNAATFKKLGVTDLPTANWTWDDMVRIAGELRAKQTSSADYPSFVWTSFNNGVVSLAHQLGGSLIKGKTGNAESPQITQALQRVKGLQDHRLIPSVKDSTDFNEASALISGSVPMAEIPSWQLAPLSLANLPAGTLHAVPVPSVNGSHATDTNGLSYVMNAYSNHKKAAWQLIKFLTSTEGATLQVEGGASPAANVSSAVADAYYKANGAISGLKEAFKPMLAESYLRTTTQYPQVVLNFPQIESALGDYYAGSLSVSAFEKKTDTILNLSLK